GASREAYEGGVGAWAVRRNAGRGAKVAVEMRRLRARAAGRLETLERIRVGVSRSSTIRVKHNIYSVPARLRGEQVEARVGMDTIEVWYADQLVQSVERLRGQDKHHIDYR